MLEPFTVPFWFTNPVLQTIIGTLTPPEHHPLQGNIATSKIGKSIYKSMVYQAKEQRNITVVIVPDWGQSASTGLVLRLSALLQSQGLGVQVLQPLTKDWSIYNLRVFLQHKQQQIDHAVLRERTAPKVVLIGLGLGGTAALSYAALDPSPRLRHVLALSPILDLKRLKHRFFQTAHGLFPAAMKANWYGIEGENQNGTKFDLGPGDIKTSHHILLAKDDPFISSLDVRMAQDLRADIFEHGGHCGFVTVRGIFDMKHHWLDDYVLAKLAKLRLVAPLTTQTSVMQKQSPIER